MQERRYKFFWLPGEGSLQAAGRSAQSRTCAAGPLLRERLLDTASHGGELSADE